MKNNDQKSSNKLWRALNHLFGATKRFSYDEQCKACKQKELTKYGRSVILFGKLVLNAATDDFVIFGYMLRPLKDSRWCENKKNSMVTKVPNWPLEIAPKKN